MNNKKIPELQHEVGTDDKSPESLSPVVVNENQHLDSQTLPGWTEYSEATLGEDGKVRDQDGNIVEYPHHLTIT